MGLLESSDRLRNYITSRNIYTVDNQYELGDGFFSSAFDLIDNFTGFDPRSTIAGTVLNRLEQASESNIVKIGAWQLAVNLTRRKAHETFNKIGKKINVSNLFDKNPDTSLIEDIKSFEITPDLGVYQGAGGDLRDMLRFEPDIKSQSLNNADNSFYGYYNTLGEGQKTILLKNISKNYYSRYLPNSNNTQYLNRVTMAGSDFHMKIPDFYDDRNIYTSPSDGFQTNDFLSQYATIRDIKIYDKFGVNNKPINEIGDTVKHVDYNKDIEDNLGFGRLERNNNNWEENSQLDDKSFISNNEYKYGQSTRQTFNARRGLLAYTTKLATSQNSRLSNINPTTTAFTANDNKIVYKGNSCKSYTYNYQFDRLTRAIRYNGNGNEFSVIGDTVEPQVYPKKTSDVRKLMFSIENLAWTKELLNEKNIPECERGYNGGRLMWFPPYGLSFNETAEANWDTNNFLGRIEPIYSYNGAERRVQIDFILIIDTPPHVKDITEETIGNFFNGCDYEERNEEGQENKDNQEQTVIIEKPSQEIAPEPSVPNIDFLKFYFKNDSSSIDRNYEKDESGGPDNKLGLNEGFLNNYSNFIDFLDNEDSKYYNLKTVGYTSLRHTNQYNKALSYRRAANLLADTIDNYNNNASGKNRIILEDKNGKSINTSFLRNTTFDSNSGDYNVLNEDNNPTFRFKDKNNTIGEAIITGKGEQQAEGQSGINTKSEKDDRFANIKFMRNDTPPYNDLIESNEPTEEVSFDLNDNEDNEQFITKKDDCNKFFEDNSESKIIKVNRFKTGYYRPVFNSQTPKDFQKRYNFLHQCTRPGQSLLFNEKKDSNTTNFPDGQLNTTNSLYGKSPYCVLRIGDFWHTKMIINTISFDFSETTWDMNPEGMGMQPMIAKISMDCRFIGGQSLEFPINRLQTAIDEMYSANSSYTTDNNNYYPIDNEVQKMIEVEKTLRDNKDKAKSTNPSNNNNNKKSNNNKVDSSI